jgi:hypothetical protein
MSFFLLLLALLVATSVHALVTKQRAIRGIAQLALLYLLVGYCGIPMLAVSVWFLVNPAQASAMFGFSPGPVLTFFGYAYLGMSLISVLALRYRGRFLIAPAVCWAVYLGGATLVHFHENVGGAGHMHGGALEIFASHGLIAVLLVICLLASGLLDNREPP